MINKEIVIENTRKFIDLLELQAANLKGLQSQAENIEWDIVGLPKEVIKNLTESAVITKDAAFEVFKSMHELSMIEEKTNVESLNTVQDKILDLAHFGNMATDYLDSIGKLEEFTEYVSSKGIQ